MYGSAFCRAYDAFGWNVYPEMFARQLLKWLAAMGARPRRALDLGCGTGVLCEQLWAAGIEAQGVDLSPDMVALAQSRAPQIAYAVGDMTAFRPDIPVDLVTCTGDALNHLPDLGAVARTFESIHASLNPGGYLVFDLLNEGEIPSEEPFELEYSPRVRAVFRARREEGGGVCLAIDVYEDGALKTVERIHERLYAPADVCRLLDGAGFEVLQCADRLLLDGGAPTATWFIAARRL